MAPRRGLGVVLLLFACGGGGGGGGGSGNQADAGPSPDGQQSMSSQPHRGTATLSGGVTAASENYKIILSTGQAPGGGTSATSSGARLNTGLPGATQ